jgi:glycine/D-amino acid oxidase-like deaminating enzyme
VPDIDKLIAEAKPKVFWTDRPGRPVAAPQLDATELADLVIVGSGFTGLWAALQAVEENPGRDVVVLEAEVAGFGASSRNGGFCEASLTHGLENGLSHWPSEIDALQQMGEENLEDLLETLERLNIDAAVERTGQVTFATAPWQIEGLKEYAELSVDHGEDVVFLDQEQARAEVDSPTYVAGVWDMDGAATVDPGLLAWGLRRECEKAGVRFFDYTRVRSIEKTGAGLKVLSDNGSVDCARVVVATNAWAEPEKVIRHYVIPIYDHVLMTEPLTDGQLGQLGWKNRQGLADAGSQFHYYRLTKDNRILWGGYDANYYKGNGLGAEYETQTHSHTKIAGHFFETFPQLEDVAFSHRWAGPIGTTSKFTAAFGTKHDNRLAWAAGYTGLGVGASRWGARVALDLVDGLDTERTALQMVRRKPVPFPPEPLRNMVIQFTRNQIAKSDTNGGEPGLWLKVLDKFGVGFDS